MEEELHVTDGGSVEENKIKDLARTPAINRIPISNWQKFNDKLNQLRNKSEPDVINPKTNCVVSQFRKFTKLSLSSLYTALGLCSRNKLRIQLIKIVVIKYMMT